MLKMTGKQKIFIDNIVKGENITNSAKKAKYSEKTALSIGSENLRKPYIKAAIDARMAKIAKNADITAERLVEMFLEHRTLAIKGKRKQIGAANQAVESLAKHTGFYAEDNKQSSPVTINLVNYGSVKEQKDE